MRAPKFALKPVDETFFTKAPIVVAETFHVDKPAADVWAEITEDNPLSWCKSLKDITWTSPRPFGVGTTRVARTTANLTVISEFFFLWDEGRQKSFYVTESNGPLFTHFAEDYLVEPTSETTCDFSWTIAAAPNRLAKLAKPVIVRSLTALLTDTRKHYS